MADEADTTPMFYPSPWSDNLHAERDWILAIDEADKVAIAGGACKMDLIMAHMRAAAQYRGIDLWDWIEFKNPDVDKKPQPGAPDQP